MDWNRNIFVTKLLRIKRFNFKCQRQKTDWSWNTLSLFYWFPNSSIAISNEHLSTNQSIIFSKHFLILESESQRFSDLNMKTNEILSIALKIVFDRTVDQLIFHEMIQDGNSNSEFSKWRYFNLSQFSNRTNIYWVCSINNWRRI
jgi:hypothetical protein